MSATVPGTPSPQPGEPPRPWYREPWPWILMAGPALVVIAGFITLWLAVRSDDGLVVDDYYKEGLAIRRTLERDQEAVRLALAAEITLEPAALNVSLHGAPGLGDPRRLRLRIAHPTQKGRDLDLTLERMEDGRYRGAGAVLPPGRWLVALEDDARRWRLTGEWRVPDEPRAMLSARRQVGAPAE